MRCFYCNSPSKSQVCPECEKTNSWRRDPVKPKPAPIPEVHESCKNDAMSVAFRAVLGRKARIAR